jgi:hypothetical protein
VERRLRTRRVLKWTCTLVCAAIALGWFAAQWQWLLIKTGTRLDLSLAAGYVIVDWWTYHEDNRMSYDAVGFPPPTDIVARLGLTLPHIEGNVFGWRTRVPFWILLGLALLPTAWLWSGDSRKIPVGHCQRCGYNLTGNVSGVCPECGTAIPREGENA